MIPKYSTSNLAPQFLENMEETEGYEYTSKYVDDHADYQGERCKWLQDNEDSTTTCLAHDRKSSDCINYPDATMQTECRVGKRKMEALRT